MKKIDIWTDGSCKKNPGPGGFGVLIIDDNEIISAYNEICEQTTNNREEMKAIIYAFEYAINCPDKTFIIHSDSAYCVNMINNWIFGWANRNWINSKGKEVENLDLVKVLYEYINIDFFNCQVVKTSGHVGIIENELADALATNDLKKFAKLQEKNCYEDNERVYVKK